VVKKLARWLVIGLIAIPVIVFSLANRQSVSLTLSPFMEQGWTLEAPLFVLVLAGIVIGMVIGGMASWFNQAKWRRAAREARLDAEQWRNEIRRLNADASPGPADSRVTPVPPPPA
jgi:uncharacterized integral membrane protein